MVHPLEEPNDDIADYATVLEAWSKVKLDKPLRDGIWSAVHAAELVFAFPDTPQTNTHITDFNTAQRLAERELLGARTKGTMPSNEIRQGVVTLDMATSLVRNVAGPERRTQVRTLAISYDA